MITFDEAKSSIAYVKLAHPEKFVEMGGDSINDEKIKEALTIVDAISGALNISDDELLKKELTRICNATA